MLFFFEHVLCVYLYWGKLSHVTTYPKAIAPQSHCPKLTCVLMSAISQCSLNVARQLKYQKTRYCVLYFVQNNHF